MHHMHEKGPRPPRSEAGQRAAAPLPDGDGEGTAKLEECEAKISDFGLARDIQRAGHSTTRGIIGTPAYMAPEQATGSHRRPEGGRLLAGAAILYRLLTGRAPHRR